jgi:uncharacterized protein (TIGR03437 family)
MMFRQRLPLFALSLACLAIVPAAKGATACFVSGVPTFSGAPIQSDGNGNMFYTETGGSGSVSIHFTMASLCTYYVSSDSSWLTTSQPTSVTTQSTSVTVTFNVAANSASFRTGHLTVYVNGASVASAAVDENSSACRITITSANPVSVPAAGGTFTFSFTTGGCLYDGPNFSTNWMYVANGGYAPFAITVTVLANSGSARSGTIGFTSPSGQSVTVNQASGATAPLTLNCTPASGPTAVGTPYSATCTASGGVPPYTWSISTGPGSLPPNLTLSANGSTATISGTPTGGGGLGYSYTVKVADSTPTSATQSYSGTLTQTPTITSLSPSSATAGGPNFGLTVNGTGFAPGAVVNWGGAALATLYVGPTQLTALVPASLIASAGTAAITVTSGNVTTGAARFTINPSTATLLAMSCSPATGPAVEGASYLATCTASGGTAPYTWSIGSGALPQGLAPSGTSGTSITISGTPQSTGQYSYSVKVTDSSTTPQSQSQSYSGTIAAAAPAITSLNCNGTNGPSTVGVRYADTCTAPNGTAPFAWSISAGALPGGLTLNGSATGTATVSGTPTSAGPYSYTLKVSDSTSPTPLSGTQVFSGTIGPAGSPTLTVSPASLSFTYRPDIGVPVQQSLSLFTTGTATSFTIGVTGSWLSAAPSGGQTPGNVAVSVVNVASLAPGTYNGQVTVTALNVNPPSVTVPVTLTVQAVPQPQLTVGQTKLAYGLTQGSAAVQAQLLVTNPGGGVLSFTTAVTGCSCVSVSTNSGQASAAAPAAVGFTVNPAGLPPSTYNSAIVISASNGETATVPVQTAVNSLSQSIVLTQTGFLFETVAQGGAPPVQSFNVINAGQGTMNYSLSVQTLSGTPGWVSVSPSSGSVAANAVSAPVVVTVNPTGLPIGQYYATVQVIATNAGNSPQVVSVLLNVVDPSQGAVLVSPTGVLVGSAASTNLTSPLTLYNLSNQALGFTSTVSTTDGGNWLLVSPSTGTVPAKGSVQVTVSGNSAALPTGTGQGVVRVGFSNGIVQSIGVSSLSIAATSSSSGGLAPAAQTGCQTQYLVPTVTGSIGPSFTVTQSQPVSLSVSVVDNCNNTIPSATVTANFNDGDSSLTLVPQGGSVWTGTWTPKSAGAQVNLVVVPTANFQGTKDIAGLTTLTGTVQPAASTEAPAPASALNSANASPGTQISPGSWVTIFGDRMANATQSASGTFPPSLVGTAVMIGSTALPLDFVDPNQVNALLPFSLTPNSTVSLAVQRSGTISVPLSVTIADVGPAIFALNGAGTGQGAVTISSSGVIAAPVGTFPGSQPVARGDFLSIYCTGLGAVNNTPADGAPAPSSPPLATTLANPTVTIGGMPATVSYSGLAPGLVGLYQVNVQVPNNAPTGPAVNLSISVGSLTSNTVTVAVQ